MDQRGGAERQAGATAAELALGQPAELVVEQREQRIRGLGVVRFRALDELGEFDRPGSGGGRMPLSMRCARDHGKSALPRVPMGAYLVAVQGL